MKSWSEILELISSNVTNKTGRIRKSEHGEVEREMANRCIYDFNTKQDINVQIDYDVTNTDETNGYITIGEEEITDYIKIFKNGLFLPKTAYSLNSPANGNIEFTSDLTEGELITYFY